MPTANMQMPAKHANIKRRIHAIVPIHPNSLRYRDIGQIYKKPAVVIFTTPAGILIRDFIPFVVLFTGDSDAQRA